MMTLPHSKVRKIAHYSYADADNFNKTFVEIDENFEHLGSKIKTINDVMYVDPQGKICIPNKVGIGVENPTENIEVKGNIKLQGDGVKIRFQSDNTDISDSGAIEFGENNDTYFRVTYDGSVSNGSDGRLTFHGPQNQVNEILVLERTGNVGIGTSSPSTKLDVGGDVSLQGPVRIGCSPQKAKADRLRIGNGFVLHDGGHKVIGIGRGVSGSGDSLIEGYNAEIRLDPQNGQLFLGINSHTKEIGEGSVIPQNMLTIKAGGNVGIGTRSPSTKLDVTINEKIGIKSNHGSAKIEAIDAVLDMVSAKNDRWGSAINFIEGNGEANTDMWSIARQTTGGDGDSSLRLNFGTKNEHFNDCKVAFTSNGDVGIGTSAPAEKLEVAGNLLVRNHLSSSTSLLQLDFGATNTYDPTIEMHKSTNSNTPGAMLLSMGENPEGYIAFGREGGGAAFDEMVRITVDGCVGIGTTTPSYKLDVNGTIRGDNVSDSDEQLKTNVQPIEDSLAKVACLRGVNFHWTDQAKGKKRGQQIGVIAQEVEKVFPEVVVSDADGYKSVAYDKLVAPLIEAVKEQQQQINQQKLVIEGQQQTIAQQQKEVSELRQEFEKKFAQLTNIVQEFRTM